jgi:hypothetical protein
MGGSAGSATRPARSHESGRVPAVPRPRSSCSWGRTGNAAATTVRATAGSRRSTGSAHGTVPRSCSPQSRSWMCRLPRLLLTHGLLTHSSRQHGAQRPVQLGAQPGRLGGRGPGQRPDHHLTTLRQQLKAVPHDMAKPPCDPVSNHRAADGFAHHKTYPSRVLADRAVRNQNVHHNQCAPNTTPPSQNRGEFLAAGQPGGGRKHSATSPVRRTTSPGFCGAARSGSPGRRGSASGAGSRGYANGGGCSAGRCACPCSLSSVLPYLGQPAGAGPD